MKILLDECVNKRLKSYLNDFEVYTVTEMGWSGTKNGELIQFIPSFLKQIHHLEKNKAYIIEKDNI